MVLNRQDRVRVNLPATRRFVQRLRRVLHLGQCDFNVCFVDDRGIRHPNRVYRGKDRPTDVLSFPWAEMSQGAGNRIARREFKGFLGDVIISVERARRNARVERHSTQNEIRWLILHGVLHLLGYDHETDRGEMTTRELALRERLGLVDQPPKQRNATKGTAWQVGAIHESPLLSANLSVSGTRRARSS